MAKAFKVQNSGRLDKVLSQALSVSRNQVEKLIKEGLVSVDGKIIKKRSFIVSPNQKIAYEIKEAPKKEFQKIEFEIEKLYEDEDVLVINKPPHLVVHPAASVKEPTLVDWLRSQNVRLSTLSGEERNGIVHRLDKETSGALLIAKNNFAHEKLSKQLQDRSMGRYYLAIINYPLKEDVIVDKAIGRNPKNRLKMAAIEGARAAKTHFVKIATGKKSIELIGAKLFSGRTHQIRVHLSTLGRHIIGDKLYGPNKECNERMMLHASVLYFIHPRSNEQMQIMAPLMEDMKEFMEKNFQKGLIDELFTKEKLASFFTNSIVNK